MITLYIKTHNKTGLKYFGQTTKNDVNKYKGSGVYWLRHLKIHGNDVTTEILKQSIDKEFLKEIAIKFSKENDIIHSSEWANLKYET